MIEWVVIGAVLVAIGVLLFAPEIEEGTKEARDRLQENRHGSSGAP